MKDNGRLLLVAAIAALALLAVPASASASVWKHEGSDVEEFVSIGLTGGEFFEIAPTGETKNGMFCNVHATLTTEGGSTGKITAFETEKCEGFGSLAECELKKESTEPTGLNWTVDVNASDLTITGWHTMRAFKAGCSVSELDKTIGSVTVTLDTPSAIAEMEWLGEITGYKTRGSFSVDSPNSGTYGIG